MSTATTENRQNLPSLQSGGSVKAIVPQDFDGVWRIAKAVVAAGMAPRGLETAEKAMVAIMHGMEVGMTPMAALQSIAVVNGRPTIWGDGALGLIQGSGKLESHKEYHEGEGESRKAICIVKRKGDPEAKRGEFSVGAAKKAGLWGKSGPWSQYSDRMLMMRARGFALRDGFSDVLRGLGIAEEVQDTPMRDVTPQPPVPPTPPAPPAEDAVQADADGVVIDHEVDAHTDAIGLDTPDEVDDTAYFEQLEEAFAVVSDATSIEEVWTEFDPLARFDGKPNSETNQGIAMAIRKRAEKRIGG